MPSPGNMQQAAPLLRREVGNGEMGKVEAVTDFIVLGSKITVDGDCSHETNRRLLLGRKSMTILDSVLKSKDIILPTKIHLSKLWFFW